MTGEGYIRTDCDNLIRPFELETADWFHEKALNGQEVIICPQVTRITELTGFDMFSKWYDDPEQLAYLVNISNMGPCAIVSMGEDFHTWGHVIQQVQLYFTFRVCPDAHRRLVKYKNYRIPLSQRRDIRELTYRTCFGKPDAFISLVEQVGLIRLEQEFQIPIVYLADYLSMIDTRCMITAYSSNIDSFEYVTDYPRYQSSCNTEVEMSLNSVRFGGENQLLLDALIKMPFIDILWHYARPANWMPHTLSRGRRSIWSCQKRTIYEIVLKNPYVNKDTVENREENLIVFISLPVEYDYLAGEARGSGGCYC